MKLKPLAANMTELHTASGAVILFSYQTPVAAQLAAGGFVRTAKRWSVTTSRHINKWLDGAKAREVPQEELDGMVPA